MTPSRPIADVVTRANVLGVLALRALFEGHRLQPNLDLANARAMAAGATAWLFDARLPGATLDAERALLQIPPLTWRREAILAVQGAALDESVATLLYALSVLDRLPAYDEAVDTTRILHLLPFLSDSPFVTREGMPAREEYESMLGGVTLRPVSAVRDEERRAGLYWWRARSHALVRAGQLSAERLRIILEEGAPKSRDLGIRVDARGEFVVLGRRYAELDAEAFAFCSCITEARLRALRWLLSPDPWDAVDMSS